MPSISINPLTFGQRSLFDWRTGQPSQKEFTKLLGDMAQWANQMQSILVNPVSLASILNNNKALFLAQGIVEVSSAPTTNQTVNANQMPLVWIGYNWATAANFTATVNNLVDGAIVVFRFNNGSGAARTVTLAANTPTPSAYAVQTANNTLSAGVSVANGTIVSFFGMANSSSLQLSGVGQNW